MKAEIRKIDKPKKSFNGSYIYQRVRFKLEDGKFAKTDLCPSFRNYKRWKPLLEMGEGTKIKGVRVKGGVRVMTIDADSDVSLYCPPEEKTETPLTLFDE